MLIFCESDRDDTFLLSDDYIKAKLIATGNEDLLKIFGIREHQCIFDIVNGIRYFSIRAWGHLHDLHFNRSQSAKVRAAAMKQHKAERIPIECRGCNINVYLYAESVLKAVIAEQEYFLKYSLG